MYKKLITLSVCVLITLSMVACNKDKMSSEEIEGINNNETIINDMYNEVQNYIILNDECIETEYKNNHYDRDDIRTCEKSIRILNRDLEKIDMNEMKEYYTNENNINKYNELKNKYNQINRTLKYTDIITDMFKDGVIDDNEAFNWICMREICNSDKPFSKEMKDNDEYKSIEEKYGFSLIDKQNEFDKKYEVKDIN
ncbi:hypothetical protein SAMN02910355_3338 [Terrisporobacter glycolicus]|nr:hypothetical protein SAMN02910355_3338 [Terrisporobacter glycolicus]